MSELNLPENLKEIAERARITGDDVRDLRMQFFGDHRIEKHEVEALLELDRRATEKCRTWQFLLTDAFVNYLVEQSPCGRDISVQEGEWFAACIAKDGVVDSPELFELLVTVMERAGNVPQKLERVALEQVSEAVLNNQGPVAALAEHDQQVICKSDVELIRRLLFSCGGDGGLAITRMEAEFLFNLNDKTISNQNDDAWSDLFVRAVGNHLMATLGDAVPRRDVCLVPGQDVSDQSFWSGFLSHKLRWLHDAMKPMHEKLNDESAERNRRIAERRVEAENVTQEEASWVADRIGADGTVHENERALLEFLREERGELPDNLKKIASAA